MHENLQVQFGQYFLSVTVVKIIRYGLIAIIKEKKSFLKLSIYKILMTSIITAKKY